MRAPRGGPRSHRFVSEAADIFEVPALDPDQPGRTLAARRVQVALVVEVGDTRRQCIFPNQPHLAGLVRGGGLEQSPVAHHRLAARLPVDRPARTVVVRLAFPGTVIDMAENAEPEFRILVEDLALRHAVVEMRSDEILVLQQVLDERADFPAPLDPRIFRQDAMTLTGKPLESIAHQITSSLSPC